MGTRFMPFRFSSSSSCSKRSISLTGRRSRSWRAFRSRYSRSASRICALVWASNPVMSGPSFHAAVIASTRCQIELSRHLFPPSPTSFWPDRSKAGPYTFDHMPLLRVDRLSLVYGATDVVTDLTFQVEPRQRLGIVGANGSGKSSLMKAISGELTPARGSLALAARARTPYLAPQPEAAPHESVYADALHSRPDIIRLRERLTGLEAAMTGAAGSELGALVEEYGDVQHEYERLDGYAYDNRVAEVLHGVGLTESDQQLPPK